MTCALNKTRQGGFTLIELMVAISIMALMAVLSWRGLDGMTRAQALTSQRSDEVLTLQTGLAQWKVDLDMLTQTPRISSLDWDGRVLRLTRRTVPAGNGLVVVAWTRRSDLGGQWLRWQSPELRTFGGWYEAWGQATRWAQNAGMDDRSREVLVMPLDDWQIFYFRTNAWTNPLSTDASLAAVPPASGGSSSSGGVAAVPAIPPVAGVPARPASSPSSGLPGSSNSSDALPATTQQAIVPEGIRLVLTLPEKQAIGGKLILDWVRPTLGGGKS